MILLKVILEEAKKEQAALDFLSQMIKKSPFAGKVFLAGGGVRDEIMGRDVKDIDVVVASPEGGIKFAEWLTKAIGAYKEGANPVIFPRFGTAKFNLRGIKVGDIDLSDLDIEAVMTRGETYTPGSRKPAVNYADLKTDVERRDFTVNTLLKDLTTGEIKDLTGKGIHDIQQGIIRTPLDPDITFKDDPLRMLRAVRFVTKYNWKMPKHLLKALVKNAGMLETISSERIQEELNKMLMTDNPDKALKLMTITGLMKYVIPELDEGRGVKQNIHHHEDVYSHILSVVRATPKDLKARLAAIFHDIAKPRTKSIDSEGHVHFYEHEDVGAQMAEDIMRRLKYSNEMIESVSKIVRHHMDLKGGGTDGNKLSNRALRRFALRLGDDLESAFNTMHADNLSHSEGSVMPNQIPNIKERTKSLLLAAPQKPDLPVNGHDLLTMFHLKPGPHIKIMLAAVQDAWMDDPTISKEKALAVAKSAYDTLENGVESVPEDILNKTVLNPETNNQILVRTALQYEKGHPARLAAEKLLRK